MKLTKRLRHSGLFTMAAANSGPLAMFAADSAAAVRQHDPLFADRHCAAVLLDHWRRS